MQVLKKLALVMMLGALSHTLLADPVLVDVRTPQEFAAGHVPGALSLPLDTLPEAAARLPDRDAPIVLYCRSGQRAARAMEMLRTQGYRNLENGGTLEAVAQRFGHVQAP